MTIARVGSTDRIVEILNAAGAANNLAGESGIAAGDLDLIAVSWYNPGGRTITTPAGYTKAGGQDYLVASYDDDASYATLFYKVLTGSEGASSIQFSGNVYANAVRLTLRGASALNLSAPSPGTAGSGTICTAPDVAGSAGQALICPFFISDPATFATPTDMTPGPWNSGANTNSLRWFLQVLAGDVGAKTTTLSSARDNLGFSFLVSESGADAPVGWLTA